MCPLQIFWVKLLLLSGVFFWWGKVGGGLGCWRMVVVGSWGPSFKRWIAWQRHGNHWRVIRTDLLKFNLFLKILWAAYFDWHGKKPPKPKPTIPNWIEINPPKSTQKKPTNHTPKLKPHFRPFSTTLFLSGRLGGPHGWTTLQGDALGDSLCELCLSGGMSAQPLREGVSWLGRWLSSWLVGWLICCFFCLICCFF